MYKLSILGIFYVVMDVKKRVRQTFKEKVLVLVFMVMLLGCGEYKSNAEKDLEFTTKVFQCMSYCRDVYEFDGCRDACFLKEGRK